MKEVVVTFNYLKHIYPITAKPLNERLKIFLKFEAIPFGLIYETIMNLLSWIYSYFMFKINILIKDTRKI